MSIAGQTSGKTIIAVLAVAAVALVIFRPAPAQERVSPKWHIQGELTEACTCSVPCTCNFGESPSPHDYCWAMWSYWVKQGRFDEVDLAGMHIGGVEGEGGTLGLLDVQAGPEQRRAMEQIWHALSGRLLCHVRLWPFKAGPESLEPDLPKQGAIIRTRYADRKFLGFEFIEIEQVITNTGVKLQFGNRGGFEARYIFGRDAGKPVTVRNIVSWPIPESIKGKTVYFQYKDQFNELNYAGTNSNQGHFDLNDQHEGTRTMTTPR